MVRRLSTAYPVHKHLPVSIYYLFICLFVWGSVAFPRPSICIHCLDNSPQGILSYPVTPFHSQPASQQAAVEESATLICLSSDDRDLPVGAAMTSQAAWETGWWRLHSVLLSP